MTFYVFFELLHTFSRTLAQAMCLCQLPRKVIIKLYLLSKPHCDIQVWRSRVQRIVTASCLSWGTKYTWFLLSPKLVGTRPTYPIERLRLW